MTKRMHSVISVLVAFAMVLFMGLSTLGISAGAVTQSDIDALAKKKKELQSQQASLQQTINNLRSQQADGRESQLVFTTTLPTPLYSSKKVFPVLL